MAENNFANQNILNPPVQNVPIQENGEIQKSNENMIQNKAAFTQVGVINNQENQLNQGVLNQNGLIAQKPTDINIKVANEGGNYENPQIDFSIYNNMKRGFIMKTYGILITQLILTFGIVCLSFINKVREYFNDFHLVVIILMCICFAIIFIVLIMFCCCPSTLTHVPVNYILLFSYTLSFSYLLLLICSFYQIKCVISAIVITIATVIGLTLYAFRLKEDPRFSGFFLYCLPCNLICSGIFCGCFYPFWWIILIECGCILLLSLYIIYDTLLIIDGGVVGISMDDYISAALKLYTDIVYLFIKVLSLMGGRGGNNK